MAAELIFENFYQRRPQLDSLYDVFVNVRDDEKEHWCVCILRCVAVCPYDVFVYVCDDIKEL